MNPLPVDCPEQVELGYQVGVLEATRLNAAVSGTLKFVMFWLLCGSDM